MSSKNRKKRGNFLAGILVPKNLLWQNFYWEKFIPLSKICIKNFPSLYFPQKEVLMIGIGIGIGIIVLAFGYFIFVYNKLVGLATQADEAWSGIDVQLKRRYDLIPNLVETVKGYAKHESQTLEKVIQARNQAMQASGIEDKINAENQLTSTLKTLFALSESYPDLKANTNFLELQKSLSSIEDELSRARRYYNAVTRDYNILCQTFPSFIIANMTGFRKRPFFEAAESERENVKVQF